MGFPSFYESRAHHGRGSGSLIATVALIAFAVSTLLFAATSHAAAIVVGPHTLLGNIANQKFTVLISGTDQVASLDFYAQIGDGGTFNGGTNTKPVFQNVDILTGTIFASPNNTGATGDPSSGGNAAHPLIWLDGTTTPPPSTTVLDTGVLATFTVDTTGAAPGDYPLLLSGVASKFGPFTTDLRVQGGAKIPLTITNGTITVLPTPEPASLSFLIVGGLLCSRRRRPCKR
jgi:hypothetical protein